MSKKNAKSITFTILSQIRANSGIKVSNSIPKLLVNFNFPKRYPFSWKVDI